MAGPPNVADIEIVVVIPSPFPIRLKFIHHMVQQIFAKSDIRLSQVLNVHFSYLRIATEIRYVEDLYKEKQ